MQQQLGYKTMFKQGKTALIVAITLSVLGTASAAFAGGKDGAGHDISEGKIGPWVRSSRCRRLSRSEKKWL
jgi:hypothetical protein